MNTFFFGGGQVKVTWENEIQGVHLFVIKVKNLCESLRIHIMSLDIYFY